MGVTLLTWKSITMTILLMLEGGGGGRWNGEHDDEATLPVQAGEIPSNDNPSVPWIEIGHHSLITNIDSLSRYSLIFIIVHFYSLHFISCTTHVTQLFPDPPWQSLRRTTAHLVLYYPSPRQP